MAKLTFWCDEETNEAAPSDSPYFLVYVGDAQKHKSVVKRVRKQSWDDAVDAGEPARVASISFPEISSFDLVLIALLEEDWDPDSGLVNQVQAWMQQIDSLLQPTTVGGSSVVNFIRDNFNTAIKNFLSNDDLLAVQRFSGVQTRHYFGGGGHYRVKFQS